MGTTDTKEKELVVSLINGDDRAFCELYSLYKHRLIGFAVRFIKSHAIAEDLFHDVFTQIWQGRSFLDPNLSFSAYVHTMMKNRVLNLLRDQSRKEEIHALIQKNSADYDLNIDVCVEENELNTLLSDAIERLSPKQKEVFQLSQEGNKSHLEIAQIMNISVNTVHEYKSLALKGIRKFLRSQLDENY